jgi:hypothetical protein
MSTIFQKLGAGQIPFTTENLGAWERQFAFGVLEPTALIFTATVDQLANSYSRPDDANLANYNINGRTAYFCDDTSFRDKGGGFQEWTREAATLPANYNDAEPYSYSYPGYWLGRAPFTRTTTAKLVKEFFLIGNTSAGANYNTEFEIPEFAAQNYAWAYFIPSIGGIPDGTQIQYLDGYLANSNANYYNAVVIASNPNLTTYQGWVANDNANATFSIEAADSVIEHVRGPIWMRTRRFVKAR